jgi:hypothetical protein
MSRLTAVHEGAAPIPRQDRPRYYAIIAQRLEAYSSPANHGLRDAILAAQRELLRPSI